MNSSKAIYVYENWQANEPSLIGTIFVSSGKGSENYSFEYNPDFLKRNNFVLDPDLALYRGRQYAPIGKKCFGIFADSCPDRWGRVLMKRRERILADKEGRKARTLQESDYLLGVFDEVRMGALRFKTELDGEFQSSEKALATPPWTTLRALEQASLNYERDESGLEEKWVNQLLAPGSSLGGARPKATVQDTKGSLWIAKFPSKNDDYNSGAWEMVAHDLAVLCGLNVPEAKLETFSKNGSTFLVKRFDRVGSKRIHFASAMTLLGRTDGASAEDGSSYLELAEFIRANGSRPKEDLQELWKRIVFNMLVNNTDDHMRNHGFILGDKGWSLSPLFDVNPVPYGDMLALNVSDDDNTIDLDLAVSVAPYWGIETNLANKLVADMRSIVAENWQRIAQHYKLTRGAIDYMKPAFRIFMNKF